MDGWMDGVAQARALPRELISAEGELNLTWEMVTFGITCASQQLRTNIIISN